MYSISHRSSDTPKRSGGKPRQKDSYREAKSPTRFVTTPGSKAPSGSVATRPARPSHGAARPASRFARPGARPAFGGGRPQSGGGRGKFARKSTLDFTKLVRKATPANDAKIPEIKHMFNDFAFSAELKANIAKKGYKIPTPVQDQSIPHILDGKNIIGLANTGTGKTGAFLLPLIEKVSKDRNNQFVLILAPTRELALQIEKEFRDFSVNMKIFSAMCVGGMPIYHQIQSLSRRPNFVIGTPGRIKDLADRGKIRYASFNNIVLDEVDHMLDMGFVDPITDILNAINPVRQSLFFSATMPPKILELVKKFVGAHVKVEIASRDHMTSIDQDVVRVRDEAHKFSELKRLVAMPGFDKVLIFSETKRQVDKLQKALEKDGIVAESIHGDKRQSQRRKALTNFDTNKVKIMIATDVAARGLDIKGITHVINYTAPQSNENYTHRIGRTGRGVNKGTALTFVTN